MSRCKTCSQGRGRMAEGGGRIGHPLEEHLQASAWDILDAIANGFRAQIDVKGKLAELYLHRRLVALAQRAIISDLHWLDKDGEPDFTFIYKGRQFRIECKNVRGKTSLYRRGAYAGYPQVELQKTRTGMDAKTGKNTRGYSPTHFDVLAACLFNQTGQWEFLFIPSSALQRRPGNPDLLEVFQPVPRTPQAPWTADILQALEPNSRE